MKKDARRRRTLGVKKDARRRRPLVEGGRSSKEAARRRRSLGEEGRWVSNDSNDASRDEGRFVGENIKPTGRE